jgi:hypothetical protein
MDSSIYIGTADLAHNKIGTLQKIEYRKRYESAYQSDLKRYCGELTLEKANIKIKSLSEGRIKGLKKREGRTSSFTKELLLMINPFMLTPKDVNQEILISNPRELGIIAPIIYGETLPSIRLWLHYKNYIIGVVPDGVTDTYVYEFKATTLSGAELDKVKEQAIKQNMIYAYAFKRPNVKVQIAKFNLTQNSFPIKVGELPNPEIITEFTPSSSELSLEILDKFDRAFLTNSRDLIS